MEQVKFALDIWMKLSTNTRMRDRSMKIIQYGCQMIIGFYSHRIRDEFLDTIKEYWLKR